MKPALSILLALALCCSAWAEWRTFNPPGAVDGEGMLRDIVSRNERPSYWSQKYADNIATQAHEATHGLNNRICKTMGWQAFYVGEGRYCILPEPRISLSAVAQFVSPQHRNFFYQAYLVQQPSTQPIIDQMPLYLLDEWSASINGWQAAVEHSFHDSDEQMARAFAPFSDALIEAVRRHDPQYPKLAELVEFIDYQKSRIQQLAGAQ